MGGDSHCQPQPIHRWSSPVLFDKITGSPRTAANDVSSIGAVVTRDDALAGKSVISKVVSVLEAFSPVLPAVTEAAG